MRGSLLKAARQSGIGDDLLWCDWEWQKVSSGITKVIWAYPYDVWLDPTTPNGCMDEAICTKSHVHPVTWKTFTFLDVAMSNTCYGERWWTLNIDERWTLMSLTSRHWQVTLITARRENCFSCSFKSSVVPDLSGRICIGGEMHNRYLASSGEPVRDLRLTCNTSQSLL